MVRIAAIIFLSLWFYGTATASVAVPMYGVFDFNSNTLSVFWNISKSWDSYKIFIYEQDHTDPNIRCDSPINSVLLTNKDVPVNSQSINFSGLKRTAEYKVDIFGVQGTSQSLLATQIFWVHLVTPEFGVSWCLDDSLSSKYEYTGYRWYDAEAPSYTFTAFEDLVDWKNKAISRVFPYGRKTNVVVTSVAKLIGDSQVSESSASAQLILFSALPGRPAGVGLSNF